MIYQWSIKGRGALLVTLSEWKIMSKTGIFCRDRDSNSRIFLTNLIVQILIFRNWISTILLHTRVFMSTNSLKSSTRCCLHSKWFRHNFHHAPTPVYPFRMLVIEINTQIHNEERLDTLARRPMRAEAVERRSEGGVVHSRVHQSGRHQAKNARANR